MLPDRVSNPGPLTYESGALPIALRSPAVTGDNVPVLLKKWGHLRKKWGKNGTVIWRLKIWAQLFKTNDVVKISNVNISNMPIFFVENM